MLQSFAELAASFAPRPYSEGQANLLLTFQVSTGTWRQDSIGNDYEVTAPLTIEVAARKDRLPKFGDNIGVDMNTISVKARCVYPLLLPASIKPEMVAAAQMTDSATGQILRGTFTLSAIVPSRYAALSRSAGTKIEGFLRITGGGNG